MINSSLLEIISKTFSLRASISMILYPFSSSIPKTKSFSIAKSLILINLQFNLEESTSLTVVLPVHGVPVIKIAF